jgi:hypothetical protein
VNWSLKSRGQGSLQTLRRCARKQKEGAARLVPILNANQTLTLHGLAAPPAEAEGQMQPVPPAFCCFQLVTP